MQNPSYLRSLNEYEAGRRAGPRKQAEANKSEWLRRSAVALAAGDSAQAQACAEAAAEVRI